MIQPPSPTFAEMARQALSSTREGYEMLAPKFDRSWFRTPDHVLAPLGDLIAACGPFESALDVGCGTGAVMEVLLPRVRSTVTGLDMSPGMLSVARRNLAAAGGQAIFDLVEGDALAMPFSDRFDLVTCSGALGHIAAPDYDQFISEIARVLQPGGRFIFHTRATPSAVHPAWWAYRGFNAAMHVRNAVIQPPFIMFYLHFTVRPISEVLRRHGFAIAVHAPLKGLLRSTRLVVATKT